MGKNYISKKGMDFKTWLETRQRGIGSSDVSAVLGINPFRTPLQLWFDKTEPVTGSEKKLATRMGSAMEDSIAKIYAEDAGLKIQQDHKIRMHPEHPFLIADLDRVILNDERGPGVLEVKFTSSRALRYWEADIPRYYFSQIQHQLSVTGWTWGVFLAFVNDRYDLRVIPFERNEEVIAMQNEACIRFWQDYVLKGEPPPAEASDLDLIKQIEGSTVNATTDIALLVRQCSADKERIKILKDDLEGRENQIKVFMGDHEALISGGQVVATYKMPAESVVIDGARLKKEMPEIAEKYAKARKASRRFQIREVESDNEPA